MILSIYHAVDQPSYCLPLPNIIRHIKVGTYKQAVYKVRQAFRQLEWRSYQQALELIPQFTPAGHFKRSLFKNHLVSFSQCILFETAPLPKEILDVTRRIIENELNTLACFLNVHGDGLVFIVPVDIRLDQYELTVQQISEHYAALLNVGLRSVQWSPYHYCRFSYDPLALFNPNATRFYLDASNVLAPVKLPLSKS